MKKSRSYYLGNTFILLALVSFLYLFWPVVSAYFFPSQPPSIGNRSLAIWIPKIHAGGDIIPEVDPFNEQEYKTALKKGIALGKGFALPGQEGVTYLFAHSSGPPWELTRYNTVFLRLGELKKGDTITLWNKGVEFTYYVTAVKIVNPQDVKAVTAEKKNELIIQTCTPLGTDWQRLLVYAERK